MLVIRGGTGYGSAMRAPLRIPLALVLLTAVWGEDGAAADLIGLPAVPNPYGFDLRLALRTHLEDAYAQRDVAGLSWGDLVARYRSVNAATTLATTSSPPATDRRQREAAAAEQAHRDNILLQLAREFGEHPAADTTTADLRARLAALVQAARERAPATTPEATMEDAPTAKADPAALRTSVAPAIEITAVALDLARLSDPTAVLGGVTITLDGPAGDRLAGVCFNADLGAHFAAVMRRFASSMQRNPSARSGLVLLGHGNGIEIGVGGEHPVNLTTHLRRNVASYHALLGVDRIDCVVILSCSRKADAQFTAFRDGLGYYPTWRVSAWEHTVQTLGSGLAATELALAQTPGTDFRAAVYHGTGDDIASLAEAGQRTSTQYLQVDVVGIELVFSPARQR